MHAAPHPPTVTRLSPGIVRFKPLSPGNVRDVLAAIEEGARHVASGELRGVLVDLCGLPRLGPTEYMILSHHSGQHLRRCRVAVVVDVVTGEGEALARRMGADLRVFDDAGDALAWLHEPASGTMPV